MTVRVLFIHQPVLSVAIGIFKDMCLGTITFWNNNLGSQYWEGYYLLTCIPDTSYGDTYNSTTRPTTITGGNYGIVGDNNELTIVNGDIINEGDKIYYNPATGRTGNINNWTYDYSDRSYNVTLDNGDTVYVHYGDENITIIEGNVTYIIYYIIEGSGSDSDPGSSSSPDPSPSPDVGCTHVWQQTGLVEGNCVTPTQRLYTCSLCGEQYVETIPAPGHSWHIVQDVPTKYDEDGKGAIYAKQRARCFIGKC